MFYGVGRKLLYESAAAFYEMLTCLFLCRIFFSPDVNNTQELIFYLYLGYLFPYLYHCFYYI